MTRSTLICNQRTDHEFRPQGPFLRATLCGLGATRV